MTVKQLKEKLASLSDDMQVIIPVEPSEGFTGIFFSPCVKESDVIIIPLEDLDEDDLEQYTLLNKEIEQEESFCLVPCGFFDKEPHHNMN